MVNLTFKFGTDTFFHFNKYSRPNKYLKGSGDIQCQDQCIFTLWVHVTWVTEVTVGYMSHPGAQ